MPDRLPTPELHTPEELLTAAEALLASANPDLFRAVVLEAISALEVYVHQTVFRALEGRLDPLLVKWLESKTQMDFDSRLSVIAPIATGQPVDKSASLWLDYQKAKRTRNKVTHEGRRVSRDEAAFTLETVRRWLAYLGSTASVETALAGLKRYVESQNIPVGRGHQAERLVFSYFEQTEPATAAREMLSPRSRYDLQLRFGEEVVAFEIKRTPAKRIDLELYCLQTARQVAMAVHEEGLSRGAVVCFTAGEITEAYSRVRTLEKGVISLVVIKAPESPA